MLAEPFMWLICFFVSSVGVEKNRIYNQGTRVCLIQKCDDKNTLGIFLSTVFFLEINLLSYYVFLQTI